MKNDLNTAKYTDIQHQQWSELPKIAQTGSYNSGTVKAPESSNISAKHLKNNIVWQIPFAAGTISDHTATSIGEKEKRRNDSETRDTDLVSRLRCSPAPTVGQRGVALSIPVHEEMLTPHRAAPAQPAAPSSAFRLLQCLLIIKRQNGWKSNRKIGKGHTSLSKPLGKCHEPGTDRKGKCPQRAQELSNL